MRRTSTIALAILLIGTDLVLAQGRQNGTAGLISVDFHDADISDVAKSISEITGKNFVLDDRVRGKVSIMSPTPVTVEVAYKMFLSALQVKNLCVVPVDASINKIVPLRECKQDNGVVEDMDQDREFGDQPITKIVPLKYISANEAKTALNTFVSKTGSIVAYGPTNSLLISDTAANIQRLLKIIAKLDKQNFQATVEVIPLKAAQAPDVAEKLNAIFEQQKKQGFRSRGNDVEQALEVSKIIPDTRTNSIIVVATREGLERTLDLLEELDRPVELRVDQNNVHVKHLEHADAKEIATILTSLISGVTPARKQEERKDAANASTSAAPPEPSPWGEEGEFGGAPPPAPAPLAVEGGAIVRKASGIFQGDVRLVADTATNSLVVMAAPGDYERLLPVIEQLDLRRAQVFVETLIMEVNIRKMFDIGLSGHGGAKKNGYTGFGALNMNKDLNPIAAMNDPKSVASLAGAGALLGIVSDKKFKFGPMTIPLNGALFHALQANSTLNVLSAPNILTTDNKKAEILVGQEVPFKSKTDLTSTGLSQVSIQRQKIGIQLAVTPKVATGNEVTLDVEQKVQEVETQPDVKAEDLITSERSAKTTVVAQNGQTIVIGGLIKDKENKVVKKVPLLGDIPLVGYLFRETSTEKEKTNLLIFLTPHVIHDPKDLSRVSVKKNDERRRFNKKMGIGENKALYDYNLDKGLNMAPAAESSKVEEAPKTKRFDYDRPIENREEGSSEDEDVVSRRQPRRNTPKIEYASDGPSEDVAQVPRTRRYPRSSTPAAGNPFADVRPPSSSAR